MFLVLGLAAAACGETVEPIRPSGGLRPPGSSAHPSDLDASVAGAPDAGVTPEPDGGAAVRRLQESGLLGSTPIENAAFDPVFDPSSSGWYALPVDLRATAYPRIVRRHDGLSPGELPVLSIEAGARGEGFVLVVEAAATRPPIFTSIWVGRPEGEPETTAFVSIVGMDEGGHLSARTLQPDPDSVRTLDGIRWQKLQAIVSERLVGWPSLYVQDALGERLLVTAPVVGELRTFRGTEAHSTLRPAMEDERSALRWVAARRFERLGSDPRRVARDRSKALALPN